MDAASKTYLAGVTAPEQADLLQPLWERLPAATCERLAYGWVDHAVRVVVADAFAKAGMLDSAASIAALARIVDQPSLQQAAGSLGAQHVPDESVDLLATVCGALATLDRLVHGFEIYEACFGAIMTSRMVYGDDRVVSTMRRELTEAAPLQ